MARNDVFSHIRNEILHNSITHKKAEIEEDTNQNIYEKLIHKLIGGHTHSQTGKAISMNFVKNLSKAACNVKMKMAYWDVKYFKHPYYELDTLEGFIDTPKDLTKRYNLLMEMADKTPSTNADILKYLNNISSNNSQNAEHVKDVFIICDKIKKKSPELTDDAKKTKTTFFENVCSTNPEQGLLAIVDMIEKYPTHDDLFIAYSGILSLLNSTNMKRELYSPLVKVMRICAKSGYNKGDIKDKFNAICMDLHNKDERFNIVGLANNKPKSSNKPLQPYKPQIMANKNVNITENNPIPTKKRKGSITFKSSNFSAHNR